MGLERAITLNQLGRTNEVWETITKFDLDNSNDFRLFELKGDLLLEAQDSLLSLRNYYLYYIENQENKKLNRKLINLLLGTGSWNKAIEVLDKLALNDSSYLLESAIARINNGMVSEGVGVLRLMSLNGNQKALSVISDYYLKILITILLSISIIIMPIIMIA